MSTATDKPKSGRSATSCLECQRRKQKAGGSRIHGAKSCKFHAQIWLTATSNQCSREWPCNHCQARKVPHLCHFAPKKGTSTSPGSSEDSAEALKFLSKKRKEDTFEDDLEDEYGLSDGLAQLGYMPTSNVLAFARETSQKEADRNDDGKGAQSEEIEAALKCILPKPYTDCLVQNFLEVANYQYYTIFPPQLQSQCTEWWEARSAGRRLNPEFTCLLLQVCASSTQFLEESLKKRLEFELAEKAQTLTERFHDAAVKLSVTMPPNKGGITIVQALFLNTVWFKYEGRMVEAWHALGGAIRAAQEIGMHKDTNSKDLTEFDREIRKRVWVIIWNADWQMSGVLSRPVHVDQNEMDLELPSAHIEGDIDPSVPTPIASVAYQGQVGTIISPLFQRLAKENSVELTLKIEQEVENWMETFPSCLRDVRPDRRWDEKHPYIPFMRCQLNVVAYSFLLGPLKPYLIGAADPKVKGTKLETELRVKGVDACLDLIAGAERFYRLIFPASVKYFFILFFIFDGATVLCSAIAHDEEHTLPKRDRIVLALKNSLELLEGVSHLSKTAVISLAVLKKLTAILPLTAHEKAILGHASSPETKRKKVDSVSSASESVSGSASTSASALASGPGSQHTGSYNDVFTTSSVHGDSTGSSWQTASAGIPTTQEEKAHQEIASFATASTVATGVEPLPLMPVVPPAPLDKPWQFDHTPGMALHAVSALPPQPATSFDDHLHPPPAYEEAVLQTDFDAVAAANDFSDLASMPLEHLETLWGWENLNLDLSGSNGFGQP